MGTEDCQCNHSRYDCYLKEVEDIRVAAIKSDAQFTFPGFVKTRLKADLSVLYPTCGLHTGFLLMSFRTIHGKMGSRFCSILCSSNVKTATTNVMANK